MGKSDGNSDIRLDTVATFPCLGKRGRKEVQGWGAGDVIAIEPFDVALWTLGIAVVS